MKDFHVHVSRLGVIGVPLRAVVVGVANALFVMIGAAIAEGVGLPISSLAARINPNQALFNTFLSGAIIGLTLGPLAARLPLPAGQRTGLLFAVLYGMSSVTNGLEVIFFTTTTLRELTYILLSTAISYTGIVVLLTVLFRPRETGLTLGTTLREVITKWSRTSMVWRFALAGLLYLPLFFVFGLLVYPFVQSYYQDSSLGMVVPRIDVILAVEIARGFLIVLTVYPLITIMGRSLSRWGQTLWVALAIVVPGAWLPMIAASVLPMPMRLLHALENTASYGVYGILIVWLLGLGGNREVQPQEGDVKLQTGSV